MNKVGGILNHEKTIVETHTETKPIIILLVNLNNISGILILDNMGNKGKNISPVIPPIIGDIKKAIIYAKINLIILAILIIEPNGVLLITRTSSMNILLL